MGLKGAIFDVFSAGSQLPKYLTTKFDSPVSPRGAAVNAPRLLHFFFIFGKNIFRRGAHGKCLACEMFNFEIISFAEAPAENAPPAKF